MINYKSRLEGAIRSLGVRVEQASGRGVALDIDNVNLPKSRNLPSMLSQGAVISEWRQFLEMYRKELRRLGFPKEPLGRFWNELSTEDRMLWTTMLPAAIAIKEEGPKKDLTAVQLLANTKSWTLQELAKRLDRWE